MRVLLTIAGVTVVGVGALYLLVWRKRAPQPGLKPGANGAPPAGVIAEGTPVASAPTGPPSAVDAIAQVAYPFFSGGKSPDASSYAALLGQN